MGFDQNITYRVNVDDSDFQAKLSQMRASLDTTMGGAGGFGGIATMGSMFAPSGFLRNNTDMMMGGLADFGAQIRPVTYTPPAIAMQPHFGMIQLQQSVGQSFLGAMGPAGLGVRSAASFGSADVVPPQISIAEFSQLSSRSFATRFGDALATGGLVMGGTAAGLVSGGLGAMAGEALLGGTIGSLAGGLAGGLPASMLMSSVGEMMAQNRATQSQLESGSFRFITGGKDVDPLTGRGFSRRARTEAANFMQSEELRDVRFGMPEMRQALEAGMQMDMFSGSEGVEDFKTKFKGMIDTIKTISSTLHTSIKEGVEVMRGFRDMGVTDPSEVRSLTMKAETMGRMSGRTGSEMLALGQTGAEMFRGTGVRMELGFETNMQNVTLVRQMLQQHLITRETIGQAGGENSLAQQMTMNALGATQTSMGRGALMANFDPSTGALRPDFLSRMGSQNAMSMVSDAARLAGNPQGLMSLQAHQEEIVGNMSPMQLQLFGMATDMGMARTVTDSISGSRRGTPEYQKAMEENFIAMERRRGVPIQVIQANLGMMKADPEKLREGQEAAITSMAQQSSLEDLRNKVGLKAVGNFLRREFVQPLQQMFTGLSTGAGVAVENLTMEMLGGNVVSATTATRESIQRGQSIVESRGGSDAATRGGALGVIDVSGNIVQRNLISGQSGEALAGSLQEFGQKGSQALGPTGRTLETLSFQGMTATRFKSVDDVKEFNRQTGQQMHILTQSAKGGGGTILAVPSKQLAEAERQRAATEPTAQDLEKAEKFALSDDQKASLETLRTQGEMGAQSVGQSLFGAGFRPEKMTGAQRAILQKVSDTEHLGRVTKELQGGGVREAFAKGAAMSFEEAERTVESAAGNIISKLGTTWGGGRAMGVFSDMETDQKALAEKMLAAGTDKERLLFRRELREKVGEEKVKIFETGAFREFSMQDRSRLRDRLERIDIANFEGIKQKKDALGVGSMEGVNIEAGGPIGQLTGSAIQKMTQMSEQLKNNMEMLLSLQKQFKENLK